MKTAAANVTNRVIVWTPRMLGIALALFLAMFALDAFDEPGSAFQNLVAFLTHLLPAALVGLVVLVAWRWEAVGAVSLAGLGVLYLVSTWGRLHWSAYAAIAGPLFLTAALFAVSWSRRRDRQSP